jgi:hypothetical protein
MEGVKRSLVVPKLVSGLFEHSLVESTNGHEGCPAYFTLRISLVQVFIIERRNVLKSTKTDVWSGEDWMKGRRYS